MSTQHYRCTWSGSDQRMIHYHDTEWGVPVHDDQKLFEFLILEGAQAGLSWKTILHKRDTYRTAFAQFNPRIVATFTQADVESLIADPGIVRNKRKIQSAIQNAQAFLAVQKEYGSFATYLWSLVPNAPITHSIKTLKDVPIATSESDRLSNDLKKRGFSFVGPTICYSFMQAVGLVNDHENQCFRHSELGAH